MKVADTRAKDIMELFQIASNTEKTRTNTNKSQGNSSVEIKRDIYTSSLDEMSIVDITGLPELKAINNELTIPTLFCLGYFNGKEINMRMTLPGGFETTNNPRVPGDGGGMPVTPEQKRLGDIYTSFTGQEHKNIMDTAYFVHNLWAVTNGKFKMNELNDLMHHPAGNTEVDIKYQMERVGIDITKPFTINGYKFIVDDKLNFILQ